MFNKSISNQSTFFLKVSKGMMMIFNKKNEEKKVEIIVKSHRLNTAIQTMSLIEIRILQLAIIDARETGKGLDTVTPLEISAKRYAEAFNVNMPAAYKAIMSAEKTLFNRQFTFIDDKKKIKTRWIQQVAYLENEGAIEIIFTTAVVEEISRLDSFEKKQFFSKYMLEQTASLKSTYSVRLYELLVQWLTAKKTPVFEFEQFRGQLGLAVNEYEKMSDFKRRVLDLAVKEINDKTDLKISYEQVKKGRTIVGFKFTVHEKLKPKTVSSSSTTRDQNTPDLFHTMTDKQIVFFASKLSTDSSFTKHADVGESTGDFESRIKTMLADPAKQMKFMPQLRSVGYEPRA